jgi:hypothetical protein
MQINPMILLDLAELTPAVGMHPLEPCNATHRSRCHCTGTAYLRAGGMLLMGDGR